MADKFLSPEEISPFNTPATTPLGSQRSDSDIDIIIKVPHNSPLGSPIPRRNTAGANKPFKLHGSTRSWSLENLVKTDA